MTPTELLTFPRELGLKRAIVSGKNQYSLYLKKMRDKTSCYTSLYSFGKIEDGKPDYTTAIIDRAWWDFDAGERGGIELVKQDVAELISRLDGDIRIVATGRGFHVHQLFKQPVSGHQFRLPLEHYQRRKAKGLATLDGVGFPEKMTRIPNTYKCLKKCAEASTPMVFLTAEVLILFHGLITMHQKPKIILSLRALYWTKTPLVRGLYL